MEKKVLNKIRELIRPLIIKTFVKAIYIYGSSVKKKGNDIDILILIDDTIKGFDNNLKHLNSILDRVNKINKKSKLNIHFQPPIGLSLYWSLIIKGEPWVITSLKEIIVLYDSVNYLGLIRRLIKKKSSIGKELKSERLVARSQELLTDNREFRLMLIDDLFYAANESAQIFLISKGKTAFEPRKILKELEKYADGSIYFELLNLRSKANKGQLSEFTGEDLDYYTEKLKRFIKSLEDLLEVKNGK